MTYDNSDQVRHLAEEQSFQVEAVPMKNTHYALMHELVITNLGSCLDMRTSLVEADYLKRRLLGQSALPVRPRHVVTL